MSPAPPSKPLTVCSGDEGKQPSTAQLCFAVAALHPTRILSGRRRRHSAVAASSQVEESPQTRPSRSAACPSEGLPFDIPNSKPSFAVAELSQVGAWTQANSRALAFPLCRV